LLSCFHLNLCIRMIILGILTQMCMGWGHGTDEKKDNRRGKKFIKDEPYNLVYFAFND
jgi:hypothetical protein